MAADTGCTRHPPNHNDTGGIEMADLNLTPKIRLCKIDGCEGKRFARDWCSKHYLLLASLEGLLLLTMA